MEKKIILENLLPKHKMKDGKLQELPSDTLIKFQANDVRYFVCFNDDGSLSVKKLGTDGYDTIAIMPEEINRIRIA